MLKKLRLPTLLLGSALVLLSPAGALARDHDRDDWRHERHEWRPATTIAGAIGIRTATMIDGAAITPTATK